MQPLVPKIRVGEVLRGTRNLRHWLRIASILHNVRLHHMRGPHAPILVKNLYAPHKDDTFVVAANTPFCFSVWSARKNITLIFINPHGKLLESAPTYMSPSLFATWFVRTGEYFLDLNRWPHYAYYLWVLVQMNALALPTHRHYLSLGSYYDCPFEFHVEVNNGQIRESAAKYIQQSSTWGRLRYANMKSWHAEEYGESYNGFGPLMQQVPEMQDSIGSCLFDVRKNAGRKLTMSPHILGAKVHKALQYCAENPEANLTSIIESILS